MNSSTYFDDIELKLNTLATRLHMRGISAQAVHKELAKLVEMRVIRSKGAGRSLYYILVDE